ncbi:PA3611 family quorum-sensing-regulated virulence factor [Pseudomonas sp.]|uniref:PA3611 family quorum-sensing-regulated virulence factor n=1 Tax=Pseudomonas sp. TaxID=306 RepID=UPI002620E0B7|nr:PA3611 family quorum-sensing-regulated virulence factor [Pseudomonas sp.]
MLRTIIPALALVFALPLSAQAASLKDFELNKTLLKVAEKSNDGTPRAINPDLLDKGFTVDGTVLINNLETSPTLAAQMRSNPEETVQKLGKSVCSNDGFRTLMQQGATLRYSFREYKVNTSVLVQDFQASNCQRKK